MSPTIKQAIYDSIMNALDNSGIYCEEADDGIIVNVNGIRVILTITQKKYKVTFHYKSSVHVTVDACSEDEAVSRAFNKVTDKMILDGLQQGCPPDIEETK